MTRLYRTDQQLNSETTGARFVLNSIQLLNAVQAGRPLWNKSDDCRVQIRRERPHLNGSLDKIDT